MIPHLYVYNPCGMLLDGSQPRLPSCNYCKRPCTTMHPPSPLFHSPTELEHLRFVRPISDVFFLASTLPPVLPRRIMKSGLQHLGSSPSAHLARLCRSFPPSSPMRQLARLVSRSSYWRRVHNFILAAYAQLYTGGVCTTAVRANFIGADFYDAWTL